MATRTRISLVHGDLVGVGRVRVSLGAANSAPAELVAVQTCANVSAPKTRTRKTHTDGVRETGMAIHREAPSANGSSVGLLFKLSTYVCVCVCDLERRRRVRWFL